ncbi:hypothetical protein [Proteiniphilum sp.]|uniref:hypothetical protein n=1 Tax=Proteiniphilum sp. TaxID=1926877 RepID=UPI002B20FB94|nr:hypothetical protein [Proteiniphilum sp.]MEA4918296.1 hypothetical protein [Proteiniphilum sp.]
MEWKIFLIILLLATIFACNPNDDPINDIAPEDKEENIVQLKLSGSDKEINIFDITIFKVRPDKSATLLDIMDSCDSIVWYISDLQGSFNIYQPNSFIFQWGHNFFLPGEYKTYLLAYKDKKVVYGDTVSINVANNKDFLGYNWKDIKGPIGSSTGYMDVLSDIELATYQSVYNNVPSVRFFVWNDSEENSDKVLSGYINKLYGTPMYKKEEGESLLDKYNELFNYREEGAIPEIIWITPASRIVLLKVPHRLDWREYEIYAEPNI